MRRTLLVFLAAFSWPRVGKASRQPRVRPGRPAPLVRPAPLAHPAPLVRPVPVPAHRRSGSS